MKLVEISNIHEHFPIGKVINPYKEKASKNEPPVRHMIGPFKLKSASIVNKTTDHLTVEP